MADGMDVEVGRLSIPVGFALDRLKREEKRKLEKTVQGIGKKIGEEIGSETVDEMLDTWETRFKRDLGDAKEALARGLIDKKEFEKRSKEAARAFDQGLLDELQVRAKAGQLGKGYERQFIQITERLKLVGEDAAEEVQRPFRDSIDWFRTTWVAGLSAAAAFAGAKVVGLMRDAARRLDALLRSAGNLRENRRGFENVAVRSGLDPEDTLEELDRAFRSTVRTQDLMRASTQALQAELPVTTEKLGRMADATRRISESTGRDAPESFARLVNGIAKLETEILEELGIVTTLEQALRDWEQQTGRNADALDRNQRVGIFYNAVLEEMERKAARLGDEAFNLKRPLDQAAVAVQNFTDRVVEGLNDVPQLVTLLTGLGEGAERSSDRIEAASIQMLSIIDATLGSIEATVNGFRGSLAGRLFFGLLGLEAKVFGGVGGRVLSDLTGVGIGAEFQEQLEVAREYRRLLADIRSETEIGRLNAMGLNVALQSSGLRDTPFSDDQLDMLEDAVLRREALLLQAADAELKAAEALSAEELRRKLEEEAKLRRQGAERLAAIQERLQDQLRGLTTTAADDLRAAIGRMLDEANDAAARAGTEVPESFFEGVRRLLENVDDIERVEGFSSQLAELARLDPGRAQFALVDFIRAVRTELEGLEEGTRVYDDLVGLLRRAEDAWQKNAEAINKAADAQARLSADELARREKERLRDLRDQARRVEENARAGVKLANSFGLISDEAAQALETVAELGSQVFRLAGGDLSALPGAIASLASLLGGLFGGGDDERKARIAQLDAMRELRVALDKLRDTILQDVSGAERETLVNQARALLGRGRSGRGDRANGRNLLDRQAQTLVERIAEIVGVSRDSLISGEGNFLNLDLEAFAEVLERLESGAIGFGTSLEERLNALDFVTEILGDDAGDASQQLERFLATISQFEDASEFGDALREALETDGADGAKSLLQQIAQAVADGSAFAEGGIFFGLNRDEALRLLEDGNSLIEQLLSGGGAEGVSQDAARLRSITSVQADRIDSTLFSMFEQDRERNDLLRSLLGGPMVPAQVSPANLAALAPRAGGSSSSQVAVHCSFGDVQLQVRDGMIEDSQIQPVLERFADRMADEIDRKLYVKQRRKAAAMGVRTHR